MVYLILNPLACSSTFFSSGRMTLCMSKGRIKITENGPYLVTGGIPLSKATIEADREDTPTNWGKETNYPRKENYTLCRCGKSSSMPYCDGTHSRTGFIGTETAGGDPYLHNAKEFNGPDLRLTDKRNLCSRAGFCTRYGNIWNLTVNSDTPEYRRIAIEEAADCPSGRLVVWDTKGQQIEPSFGESIVETVDQYGVPGPLWIRGGIEVESAGRHTYEVRNRVTLCRCGRSDRKPFCDTSHTEIEPSGP